MKSQDSLRRDTLRFVLSAVQYEAVARRVELDDAGVRDVLARQAKMRRDSIEAFRKASRAELVEKEERELSIISAYLPAQLDDAGIREMAASVIAETGATGRKDMNKVMPLVMARTKDLADGKAVSRIVGEMLAEPKPA